MVYFFAFLFTELFRDTTTNVRVSTFPGSQSNKKCNVDDADHNLESVEFFHYFKF